MRKIVAIASCQILRFACTDECEISSLNISLIRITDFPRVDHANLGENISMPVWSAGLVQTLPIGTISLLKSTRPVRPRVPWLVQARKPDHSKLTFNQMLHKAEINDRKI